MARLVSSLADTLRLIPGYDPFATAGDCRLDEKAAQDAIDFFPECLRHVEGEMQGQPFHLQPWQRAIVGNLFGWRRPDGSRRYRECFLYVPRKNGKTPLAAGIALQVLFCDPEGGQQNYLAAGDREQAGYLFRQAKGMVEQEPEMNERARIYGGNASAGQSRSIVREDRNSFLRVVSADASTKHGGNTSLAIVDELHTQPNRELMDVFTSSMASKNRRNPLLISITTADFDRESICNEKHAYACSVRDGVIDSPWFLPVVYEAARDADWTQEEVWRAANPNYGISVSEEYMRTACKLAQDVATEENKFKRLHLNMKTQTNEVWLQLDKWDACKREFTAASLEGKLCYAGLDMSSTTDLSAFVLVFPGDPIYVLPYFWVPQDNIAYRERRDHVPYSSWVKQEFITATTGSFSVSTDYDVVRRDINELGKRFNIRKIGVDRWNSTQLVNQLAGDGFEMALFGQGFGSMTAPTKELERLVLGKLIAHDWNPVLRWMVNNTVVDMDSAENLKPTKKKSTERIDGVVAMIMALGVMAAAPGESVYETRGLLVIGTDAENNG